MGGFLRRAAARLFSGSDEPGGARRHWESVYLSKSPDAVSWYQRSPELSLAMIRAARVPATARLLDVGGGASALVDALLDAGYQNLSVLDISASALDHARRRLGPRAERVDWIAADVTAWSPPHPFELWHDRALFHFLTVEEQRRAYLSTLHAALAPGGQAIVATFAVDGPKKCSGLPVVRYAPEALAEEIGAAFVLVDAEYETHVTPTGVRQQFVYCRFRRVDSPAEMEEGAPSAEPSIAGETGLESG